MLQGRKIGFMLVSLLAAVLLWLYVVTVVAPEATTRVSGIPINIDGTIVLEERDLIITSQDVSTLALEVSTSRVNLSKLNADTIRVNADASKIREPGEYALTCTVTFPDTIRSSDVDILRKSVETVNITVARLQKKTFPVMLSWSGSVLEGYLFDAENTEIEPDEVTVIGPEEEIAKIARAVVKYDVSDLEETSIVTVPIEFLNSDNETVEFSEMTSVSANRVSLSLPVLRTREITLALELVEGGGVLEKNASVEIEPKTIQVKGPADLVDAMDDTLVVGTVDLSEVSSLEVIPYNLELPAGVANISGETQAIATIRLSGVSMDVISVSDIRLINVPEGYEAEATTRTVQVSVRGSTEEIRVIRESRDNGIYVLVDLAEHTQTGAFTLSGQVVNSTHPGVGVSDSAEIGVVITQKPEGSEEPTEPSEP